MSARRPVPVLVGAAQLLQRAEDPRQAAEPLALMQAALVGAAEDCGAPKLLARADSVYVTRGAWRYGDAGRELARRVGATSAESVTTPYGGNFAQACVIDAAREVQAGRRAVALVTGAENGRSQAQARRQGVALQASEAPGEPDRKLARDKPIFHEAELARRFDSASDVFALVESAIRHARGERFDAHVRRISALWARFAEVARVNPHAWIRRGCSAAEIGQASPDNPMISYPYTRLMNANARVDMAAALIVCSLESARAASVPEEKLVYLHAAAEADDSNFLAERAELHRSPALRLAGERLRELAGLELAAIEHVDLYSCFPAAVEVAAAELGLPETRALTVTGGLTFGGGPLNSYGLHAVARMLELLRQDPGVAGLVHGNGGWLAKHSLGVYSAQPPEHAFRYERVEAPAALLALREARVDWDGPVTLEGCTVAHRDGAPQRAIAACLTDEGARSFATTDDPATMQAMMREELCGRRGHVDGRGGLRLS
jgi:acetyl-CoA C-acetyltransferase